jgi:hypothetical protein
MAAETSTDIPPEGDGHSESNKHCFVTVPGLNPERQTIQLCCVVVRSRPYIENHIVDAEHLIPIGTLAGPGWEEKCYQVIGLLVRVSSMGL